MYQLKKIHLGSVALYSFLLIFILGVLIMLPFGLINMFISGFAPNSVMPRHFLFPFTAVFYLFFPFLYAIMGTVVNVILAFIYNLAAGSLGGIKIELRKIAEFEEIA